MIGLGGPMVSVAGTAFCRPGHRWFRPIRTYPRGMAGLPNEGAVPVDFTAPVGQVRLLIGDTDANPDTLDGTTGTGTYVFFSDDEIGGFLSLRAGNVNLAAAAILRAIAASQALQLKKWTSADLLVDGAAIATALLSAAKDCEAAAAKADAIAAGEAFKIVPTGGRAREARFRDRLTFFPYGPFTPDAVTFRELEEEWEREWGMEP